MSSGCNRASGRVESVKEIGTSGEDGEEPPKLRWNRRHVPVWGAAAIMIPRRVGLNKTARYRDEIHISDTYCEPEDETASDGILACFLYGVSPFGDGSQHRCVRF